jgi:hypothetical protein
MGEAKRRVDKIMEEAGITREQAIETIRKRRTLHNMWIGFAEALPHDAPVQQRIDMRRAFYAGAASLFDLMAHCLDPEEEPTERDLDYVSSLKKELDDFTESLARGQA